MSEHGMEKEVASDLKYMKSLAKEGQQAPLLGGRFTVLWGTLVAIALFTQWLVLTGQAPFGPEALIYVWSGIGVLGWLGSAVLGRSLRGKPGTGSIGNRAESAVWSAGGFAIFIYVLAVIAAVYVGKAHYGIFNTIMMVAFSIYGICYFTTGGLAGNRNMYVIGALCFVAAIINGALINQPIVYLIDTGFVVLVTVIPGALQMRAEPSPVV
ncbi:MAG: hypothetical protein Q9M33_12095 [Robiginitomaculum sp.]|nr:hypothetical protein [Robiginitomaculum sp.]MDQ7077943.1 hypothetical protein [Robiginitomaculum sp.]